LAIIGVLMLAAASTGSAPVDLGTPNMEYWSARSAEEIATCLTHMAELGRPKVSRSGDGFFLSWVGRKSDRAGVRRLMLTQMQDQTRLQLWSDGDFISQVSQCAPIPVVAPTPG